MAERIIDANLVAKAGDKVTPEETRQQKKARRAQVFDRGVVQDRLHVPLPDDLHGEWVPNNPIDINRKENLGFQIDRVHALKRKLHDKGDGMSTVGDVVFMTCSREDKEILDEIRKDRYDKLHKPRNGKQAEERAFASNADPETIPMAESRVHDVRGGDITSAIKAASNPGNRG